MEAILEIQGLCKRYADFQLSDISLSMAPGTITGLVGGLLCELCLRAGQFRQKSWLVLGFFCFNLGFIGDFLPLWFTKESYLEYAAQMMDAGYMATMEGLLTWPVFGIIVLSILVGSILGALLGMKLMRKHFVKAGLAQ